MLEQLLQWIAAGDAAIAGMGPVVATALAMLGAAGFTQMLKFPLTRVVQGEHATYAVRWLAILSTWLALHGLTRLPLALELVLSLAQPYAYTVVMRLIRHRWPWLEAGKVLGSAQPSVKAVDALLQRRDQMR